MQFVKTFASASREFAQHLLIMVRLAYAAAPRHVTVSFAIRVIEGFTEDSILQP